MSRIAKRFSDLKKENRRALITFITAGDPNQETSQDILNNLAKSGADLIELGMPFSDPMADGPIIQMSSLRALKEHACMTRTLDMVKSFRVNDTETPLVLMGYYNPIYAYGTGRFILDAKEAGVDGVIVVDLPPEEDQELHDPASDAGIDHIRLITPTTNDDRLKIILKGASGFLYYVAITGITGTNSANADQLRSRIEHLKTHTDLPVAVGFGIKTPDDASAMAQICDAVVVGSSIVKTIAGIQNGSDDVQNVYAQVKDFAKAL